MNVIKQWNEDVHNKQLTSLAHVQKTCNKQSQEHASS
jgi:hypothetical protein